MRTRHVIFLALMAMGCAGRGRGGRTGTSGLVVSDYNGAAGVGRQIEFDGAKLKVVFTNDYHLPAEIPWSHVLTPAERAFLSERITTAPVSRLKEIYEDPAVWDGMQLFFTIRRGAGPPRSITVRNTFVEELAALTDAVNVLLPPRYRVPYREWKEVKDREEAEAASEESDAPPRP
jgi:hypothetical protein